MDTLTALKFSSVDGARQALDLVQDLSRRGLIHIHDSAYVTWAEGDKKPKTHGTHHATEHGALGGTFWGMLFGLFFFVPILGAVVGAAGGAIVGALSDWGIDEGFVTSVRDQVVPGTSALFLLTSGGVADRLAPEFKTLPPYELIASNLSKEQEHALRLAFGMDE